ncbi:MAG TPA: hypothetical protein VK445_00880 [Dissulfurispiraceae bacterium]|nr:hypothetical protein [Dissulfurispiraceae bacterium]
MIRKVTICSCALASVLFAGLASADSSTAPQSPEDFTAKKARILQKMDDREKKMAQRRDESRACITAAQNNDDLRACWKTTHHGKHWKHLKQADEAQGQPAK